MLSRLHNATFNAGTVTPPTRLSPDSLKREPIQCHRAGPEDFKWIRHLIDAHPDWNRTKLSVHIAQRWEWRNHAGQLKGSVASLRFDLLSLADAPGILSFRSVQVAAIRTGGHFSRPNAMQKRLSIFLAKAFWAEKTTGAAGHQHRQACLLPASDCATQRRGCSGGELPTSTCGSPVQCPGTGSPGDQASGARESAFFARSGVRGALWPVTKRSI